MSSIKYFIVFVAIFIEIAVWPTGLWLMFVPEMDPEKVGRAMASVILMAAFPIIAWGGK